MHKILSTSIAYPAYSEDTSTILKYAEKWVENQDERTRQKILRMFSQAQIDRRFSIMPVEQVFTPQTFAERNTFYAQEVRTLSREAIEKVLETAHVRADQIDFFITTSCTGIMIPSVDAYLVNDLKMKQGIVRLPVTEMGCAGGTSCLMYAHELLRANPGKYALVLAVESPTSTFQLEDFSLTNAVSAAIFGDGCACVLLGPTDELRPVIQDTAMYHFFDVPHMMGFDLKETGLHIVLDPEVPHVIQDHFPHIIFPFLERNKLQIEDIQHFIFHPGGKKIVSTVTELLEPLGKNIDDTKMVLREYGNMSSATILYVLDACMKKSPKKGEKGLMLAFGPGFSAQTILLEWQ